jgi:hypothetical protein
MTEEKMLTVKCPVLNSEKDSNVSEILLRLDKNLKPSHMMCPYLVKQQCELSEKDCVFLDWKKL